MYLTAAPFHLNTKQQSIKEILPDLAHNLDPLVLKIVTLQGINKRNRRERGTDRPEFHYDPMMVDSSLQTPSLRLLFVFWICLFVVLNRKQFGSQILTLTLTLTLYIYVDNLTNERQGFLNSP